MIWTKKQIINYLEKQNDNTLFEIKKKTEKTLRSIAQNKYYFWVVLDVIADYVWLQFNYEKMELHQQIKKDFWVETTTELSTSEFAFLMKEIKAFFLEKFNVYIPDPNEVENLKSLEKYLF